MQSRQRRQPWKHKLGGRSWRAFCQPSQMLMLAVKQQLWTSCAARHQTCTPSCRPGFSRVTQRLFGSTCGSICTKANSIHGDIQGDCVPCCAVGSLQGEMNKVKGALASVHKAFASLEELEAVLKKANANQANAQQAGTAAAIASSAAGASESDLRRSSAAAEALLREDEAAKQACHRKQARASKKEKQKKKAAHQQPQARSAVAAKPGPGWTDEAGKLCSHCM